MTSTARRAAWAARPRPAAACTLAALLLPWTAGLLTVPASAAPLTVAAAPAPLVVPPTAESDPEPTGTGEGTVHVVLDDVDPTVARIGEPVTLRGRIVNDSTRRHRVSTVTVRAAWTPLTSRGEVSRWVEGEDERQAGWILGDDEVGPVVAPGAAVPFHVVVPATALAGLPDDLAALAVEVEAGGDAGTVDPGSGSDPVVLRTVLTASRAPAVATPLEHAWVVPLTLPPDPDLASTDAETRHHAWYGATGPASPARTWLDGLDLPDVTWMVDPALLVQLTPADTLASAPDPADDDLPGGGQDGEHEAITESGQPAEETGGPDGAGVTAPPLDSSIATAAPPAVTAGPDEDPPPAGSGLDAGENLGVAIPPDAAPLTITAGVVEGALDQLRQDLSAVPADQLWWTPAADPDVGGLLELGSSSSTARRALNLPLGDTPDDVARLLERGRHDVAWPALAAPTAEQITALDRAWASRDRSPSGTAAVVVPAESVTGGSAEPVGRVAVPLAGDSGVTALGADSRAAALLAQAEASAARTGDGAVAQRLLADNLTAYLQDPGRSRSLLYAPPRDTDVPGGVLQELSSGLATAPWTEGTSAADLLADAARSEPVRLSGTGPSADVLGTAAVEAVVPPPTALDPGRVRSLVQLAAQLQGLSQVLAEDRALRTWEPVLAQEWSTRWRDNPALWSRSWHQLRGLTQQTATGVHVNPSQVNFLSDRGLVQVTVVNDLPVDVEGVRVEVVPDKNLLRIIDQPEPLSVGAESRATVSFTARAVTRGQTTVTARLTAPNGTVLGDDARVSVRVQPTGVWIYWVLGSVAGVVLVVGLARALRGQPRSAAVTTPTTKEPS